MPALVPPRSHVDLNGDMGQWLRRKAAQGRYHCDHAQAYRSRKYIAQSGPINSRGDSEYSSYAKTGRRRRSPAKPLWQSQSELRPAPEAANDPYRRRD
jgi:hypothetical protein